MLQETESSLGRHSHEIEDHTWLLAWMYSNEISVEPTRSSGHAILLFEVRCLKVVFI